MKTLNIKSIKPMFTKIVVTAETYADDMGVNGVIMNTAGSTKEYQKVVAVGSSVRDIKVGDLVMINPARYIKKKYEENSLREEFVENPKVEVNIPIIMLNKEPYFLIDSSDVDYVIDDWEEEEVLTSKIITPKSSSKTIIL